MTTHIRVDAHAGWDVSVEVITWHEKGKLHSVEIVPKFTVKDFYIHSGMRLGEIKELPTQPE